MEVGMLGKPSITIPYNIINIVGSYNRYYL
jgi:hypothetical protein